MLLYLSGNTCPDISFAVNCCSRYIFFAKHSHKEALKQISRYLKLTRDCGLILNTNRELFNIDSYPGVYFSGMYGHDNLDDPVCVNSRTYYVITFSDCRVS